MIDIYLIDEEKFEHIDLLGKSPKTLLKENLKNNFKLVGNIAEVNEDAEYTAVLYYDTPLVDIEFLEKLCKNSDGCKIGNGFVKKNGFSGEFQESKDIKAKQIKTLADVYPIYKELRKRVKKSYENRNILFYDLDSCYIDLTVEIEDGAIIHSQVILKGKTIIKKNAVVFSNCELIDTVVGENVDIRSTYSLCAIIGNFTTVGPFACLRKGAIIGNYCRVGDFVEIKNSTIGDNTKMAHLAYVGDSEVGHNTNIGCGSVFANYNGNIKQRCKVGDNVFIGANANLVAPVIVHDGAYIAAGSTVTYDVPGGNLCIARSRQVLKDNWERK